MGSVNNEPVAWIDLYFLEKLPFYDCSVSGEKTKKADVPLYTHPVKELTDAEIIEIWGVESIWDDKLIEFARAILRKAQGD